MNHLKDAVSKAFDNIVASGAIEAAIEKTKAIPVTMPGSDRGRATLKKR